MSLGLSVRFDFITGKGKGRSIMTLRSFYGDGSAPMGGFQTARRVLTTAALLLTFLHFAAISTAQEYATTPFDPDIFEVPPEYRGHDPVAIVAALESEVFNVGDSGLPLVSPEYREYLEARAKTLLDKPLYGELTFRSRLAVVLMNDAELDDPERETVTCEYLSATRTMIVRRARKTPQAEPTLWRFGTFAPFAAYFSLMKSDGETYALEILTNQFKKRTPPKLESWTLVGVEEEDYERLKGTLRVLCAFNLGVGGNEYLGLHLPTVRRPPGALLTDEPFQKRPYKLLCADEPEFWLYDGATGEILAKYSAPDALNGRRVTIRKFRDGSVAEKLSTRAPEPPRPFPPPRRFMPPPPPRRFPPPPPSPPFLRRFDF